MKTIKKSALLLIGLLFVVRSVEGQSVSQLTITPANPGPNDIIYITSTLTYSGNCSYGLVYTNTTVTGSSLVVMPTYCGYGFTTTCSSTDTFSLGPLPVGSYEVQMEYHQGSICPISNFDATIAQATGSVQVGTITTDLQIPGNSAEGLRLYPNPAQDLVTIQFPSTLGSSLRVKISDLMGHQLLNRQLTGAGEVLDLRILSAGVYVVEIENNGDPVTKSKLAVLAK